MKDEFMIHDVRINPAGSAVPRATHALKATICGLMMSIVILKLTRGGFVN